MRISEQTKGVYVIAATPFRDDGALDLESTDALVDFYLKSGVDGVSILGVIGAAPKLTPEESVTFLSRVMASWPVARRYQSRPRQPRAPRPHGR